MKNNQKLKIAFIFVLYKTPKKELKRLEIEVKNLKLDDYKIYFIDNTENNLGYAAGINIGIKKAVYDGCNLFVIANPDISIKNLSRKIFEGIEFFDIWGLAMIQGKKNYYGGFLDKKRLTAGLIDKKPKKRFFKTDFVSGSLMFIKKEVVDKLGFFDETYFMYYEEVDFCYRARKEGFSIGVDTEFYYEHFENSKKNPQKNNYLFFNHFKFLLKYGNTYQKIYEFIRLPKTIFEEIQKRTFYFNFFSYNFFSILGKILSFIQFIFLITIFPPDVFGIYSLSWAHIGMFMPIVDFGTTNFGIINLPQEKKISFGDILSLRFYLSILVFVISIFSALIIPYSITLKIAIFLVSFVAFQVSLFGSLLIKLANEEKIYFISVISFFFQLLVTIAIIFVSFIFKNIIYVFGVIFIFYLNYAFFCFLYLKNKEKKIDLKFDLLKFKSILFYSFFYLLISIFARWYSRIDIFLLNFLKNEEVVGIYSSAYKFLEALMFIVTAYNLSALPILVNFYKKNRLDLIRVKIKRDFIFLLIIGFGISIIFYFFSPIFLPFFLKNKYALAIPILQIIIFCLPLILLTSIFFNFFYTIKKIHYVLGLMIFQFFFNFLLNFIFIPKYSYFSAAFISLVGEFINLLICLYLYKKIINNS